eukprot:TRINITY_DN2502_c0_g1_i4.p1 TRINITY_DN2502_c0_g1~~TRINITY_DN2502_c0_g1_i4.p1  ORF type:complete len:637 (-),score=162.62 TRINITY_DN2502_c0_g1_i4:274-2184(-)
MAREIEDPISFQADCLPTGSISFGRFEEESLDWERRSAFSHNRYLEEVKKYSRPGSVTEKKAYFEAHFKRKALLHAASSECQDGNENQTTENVILDDMTYMGEFEDHGNEEICYVHYDESPTGSDEHDYEVIDFEREEEESLSCEFQTEPVVANVITVLDDTQEIEPGEVLQTQSRRGTLSFAGIDTKLEIEQKRVNGVESSKLEQEEKHSDQMGDSKPEVQLKPANEAEKDGFHGKTELLLESPIDEVEHSPDMKKQQKASLNVKSTTEQKIIKTKGQTILPNAQNSRKISNDRASLSSVKAFDKVSRKTEKESSVRTKMDRRPPLKVPPTTCSLQKNLKPQDYENVEKSCQENASGKDLKLKKASPSLRPTNQNGQSEGCESTTRPKRVTSSRKPDTRLSGAIFNFRSDERAEKRKEFYMKLEEKLHAKEAEMDQIQARTQEEAEAEIKQLRRSLNFKATPMPSFYHGTLLQSTDGKKVVINHAKSPKMNSKSPSAGNRSAAQRNPSLSSKTANQQDHSGHSSCELPVQDVSKCNIATNASSQTPNDGSNQIDEMEIRSQASQAGKKTEARKKERETGTINNTVQQQQGHSHMVKKGERVKTRRGGGDVGKKAMKGGIVGRGSEMGHLTVHVAS